MPVILNTNGKWKRQGFIVKQELVKLFEQRLEELDEPPRWQFIKLIYPRFRDKSLDFIAHIKLEDLEWTIENICQACDYLNIDMIANIDFRNMAAKIDINTEEAIREAYNSLPSSREIDFDGKRAKVTIDIEKE